MTKPVSITSLEVYHNYKDYFEETQEGKVLALIYQFPNFTRNELSVESGLEINRITGRVGDLLKKGLIKEGETRKDYYSKNMAKTLHIPENVDWNLIKINMNSEKKKSLEIPYTEVITAHKLARNFEKNNQEIIKLGIEKRDPNILSILKLIKITKGVYKKYGNN